MWKIFLTINVHCMPKGALWLFPKVIYLRSIPQCTYTQNPSPSHNSLLLCFIWKIFHTIVINSPRVCHDIEPRSYLLGQIHSAHIVTLRVLAITPHFYIWYGWYFPQLLSLTQGCVMTKSGEFSSEQSRTPVDTFNTYLKYTFKVVWYT